MAVETPCQTPDAQFHVQITPELVRVTVEFKRNLLLDEEEATLLDQNIHNAMEMVLSRFYVKDLPVEPHRQDHTD